LVLTIFFVGFSVFRSFTYSGKLMQEITGYEVLSVGLILSLFGVGTVLGGRIAPKIKEKTGGLYFIIAGVIGFLSLYTLSASHNIFVLSLTILFYILNLRIFACVSREDIAWCRSLLKQENLRATI